MVAGTPINRHTLAPRHSRTLIRLRDAGWPAAPKPTADAVRPIMTWMMATETSDDYVELLLEELGDSAEDLRAPSWNAAAVDADRPFRVAVIGAGMSGLLAAHRLRQAGIDVVVYEKNDEVGGTWLQNTLSRLQGRCRQPSLLLLLRTTRRLAAALLDAA